MQSDRVRWNFTGNTAAFVCVLAAMWYAASSQQNAAAYVLLFALASIGMVSLPHAVANVRGLTGKAAAIKPAFAGQEVAVPIEITNPSRTRRGIRVRIEETDNTYESLGEIPAGESVRSTLRFPAPARGEHEIKRIWLETGFPMGLVRIVKPLAISQQYVVYPKPAGDPNLPYSGPSGAPQGFQRPTGEGDDFAGVRPYVTGESQRHIDWKAVARGREMMTKQFTAEVETGDLYLDLANIRSRHLEERLSQLALWIIEAERRRQRYGLRLPQAEIAPSLGDTHFHQCLRALALFR